ncbi:MAG: PfkB family carbohydrate kinase [Tenacibaculum sp.]
MKKVVTLGEIMLRLSPPGFLRFCQAQNFNVVYGGGESNVAISLANYNIPTEFVTRLPNNDIGKCALMELKKRNVKTDNIIFGGDRLGIYFLEKGAVHRGSKVIYDRTHSAMSQIETGMIDWDAVFKDAEWFHWTGITPAISQSAADVCLEALKIAKSRGITISTDINHRKKLWNYGKKPSEVMPELIDYCDIIIGVYPQKKDIADKDGKVKAEAFLSVFKQMMKEFPNAKKVVSTIRGTVNASYNTWAGVLYDGKNFFTSPTYKITYIVDRIGGGDAFVGGLIYGLKTHQGNNQFALNFAVAASCLKHTINGDANLVVLEEVEKLLNNTAAYGQISR